MSKLVCEQCEWCGPSENKLVAVNPFNADSNIFGCPSCKEAECLYAACDEECVKSHVVQSKCPNWAFGKAGIIFRRDCEVVICDQWEIKE